MGRADRSGRTSYSSRDQTGRDRRRHNLQVGIVNPKQVFCLRKFSNRSDPKRNYNRPKIFVAWAHSGFSSVTEISKLEAV